MKVFIIIVLCISLMGCASMMQAACQQAEQEQQPCPEIKVTAMDVILSAMQVAFWIWLGSDQGWW